jgi:hypothetical protein
MLSPINPDHVIDIPSATHAMCGMRCKVSGNAQGDRLKRIRQITQI